MRKEGNVIYPYSEWSVVEEDFNIENNLRNETVFSLANGYLGMRGSFEEGLADCPGFSHEGNFINGFYESHPIQYGESAYGFAKNSHTMLNIANAKKIKLIIDGEELSLARGKLNNYSRVLDFKSATLTRSFEYTTPNGKSVRVNIRRLVSLTEKHIAAIRYEVTPLDFSGKIEFVTSIDGNVKNLSAGDDPRVGSGLQGRVLSIEEKVIVGNSLALRQKTKTTGFSVACAACHKLNANNYAASTEDSELELAIKYDIDARKGESIVLEKYIAYITYKDCEESRLLEASLKLAAEAQMKGFDHYFEEQKKYMDQFWYRADIEIDGNAALQQGIRFNLFHLLQSAGKDGSTNIAAKGLTGEGYEGHYFWDTEIFVLPFFLYCFPDISRKLLEYRYSILDAARQRARELSHPKGALYPWRTIGGEECSAYFPAGTAQYHINADIAYAIQKYMESTNDYDFLLNYGAEILFETARLWADLGEYIESKGNRFCINTVTGPDEYTAIVNNNCYTNMMAANNMSYAYKVSLLLKDNYPEHYRRISEKIGLEENEPQIWNEAAQRIYFPYHEDKKLYLQDDSFLDKKPWDFENTPIEKYPLLLNFHPLVIYRHQVCKQADLVLALFLLGNRFTDEEKRINYDYYEKITTHDSSLSPCIFSVMASEIGYHQKAYDYFMKTARTDLDDLHGNTANGVHSANMAGAWMCIINGFAGLRAFDGTLQFNPYLPSDWEKYHFKVYHNSCLIDVTVNKEGIRYELLEGDEISIYHKGSNVTLRKGNPVNFN